MKSKQTWVLFLYKCSILEHFILKMLLLCFKFCYFYSKLAHLKEFFCTSTYFQHLFMAMYFWYYNFENESDISYQIWQFQVTRYSNHLILLMRSRMWNVLNWKTFIWQKKPTNSTYKLCPFLFHLCEFPFPQVSLGN